MLFSKKLLSIAGAGLLLAGSHLMAAEPTAKEILLNSYRYVGSLKSYAFDAVVSNQQKGPDGTEKRYRQYVSVKVHRPDKLRIDTKGDIKDRSSYIDNGTFTMIDHRFNYYGQIKVPRDLNKALDYIFSSYGINPPMAALIYSDMDKRMKLVKSRYFGIRTVRGEACHYIAFKNRKVEVHAWITTGDKPLVKTYTIINRSGAEARRTDTSVTWDINAEISPDTFVFKAPADAHKISIEKAK